MVLSKEFTFHRLHISIQYSYDFLHTKITKYAEVLLHWAMNSIKLIGRREYDITGSTNSTANHNILVLLLLWICCPNLTLTDFRKKKADHNILCPPFVFVLVDISIYSKVNGVV